MLYFFGLDKRTQLLRTTGLNWPTWPTDDSRDASVACAGSRLKAVGCGALLGTGHVASAISVQLAREAA